MAYFDYFFYRTASSIFHGFPPVLSITFWKTNFFRYFLLYVAADLDLLIPTLSQILLLASSVQKSSDNLQELYQRGTNKMLLTSKSVLLGDVNLQGRSKTKYIFSF
jgi:hypothetical protein